MEIILKKNFLSFVGILVIFAFYSCKDAHAEEYLNVKSEVIGPSTPKNVIRRRELLDLALKASGVRYRLSTCEALGNSVSNLRHQRLVKENKGCNVLVALNGAPGTEDLLLVPIPIYLGAGGYRVFLVHKDSVEKLALIRNLEDLKSLKIGSGNGWLDTEIMQQAGLNVVTAEYKNLFEMLQRERFEVFSRSILEVNNEKEMLAGLNNVSIDKYLLLRYPVDLFFYVSPKEPTIQKAIYLGLRRLYASGKLNKFLEELTRTSSEFQNLSLKNRKIINIPNVFLTTEEKKIFKEYTKNWIN